MGIQGAYSFLNMTGGVDQSGLMRGVWVRMGVVTRDGGAILTLQI